MPEPVIDESKCTGCNSCIEICPIEIFKLEENKAKVAKPKECIGCRACEIQCPENCIVIKED